MFNDFEDFKKFKARYRESIYYLKIKLYYLRNLEDGNLQTIFLESILVDLRAWLLEKKFRKKNITFQNEFNNFSFEYVTKQINEYLKIEIDVEPLSDYKISIEEAIKFYVDKFIAHHDFVDESDFIKKEELKKLFLSNTHFNIVNITQNLLDYIDNTRDQIIVKGLECLTRD